MLMQRNHNWKVYRQPVLGECKHLFIVSAPNDSEAIKRAKSKIDFPIVELEDREANRRFVKNRINSSIRMELKDKDNAMDVSV
jgi:hypothetical protein